MSVIIAGAGIGGLTLALCLERRGIACQVFEAAPSIEPLGVGINLLPHAMRALTELGLQPGLLQSGVETREVTFYNRFGQHIHTEPRGRFAGYAWPQVSLHRGALQQVLLDAVAERLGPQSVRTGWQLAEFETGQSGVRAGFSLVGEGNRHHDVHGAVLIGCDGIRSAVRKQMYPAADPLVYSGITMWRGVTRWPPYLTGATMAYAGWLETGKVITYPIGADCDHQGRRLTNWLVEFYVPPRQPDGDWRQPGKIDDFLWACAEMRFEWLDIPEMVRAAQFIYEYPMVDRDPLPAWTQGRVTLLGDAAHPMYPRGSNGAGQAILDADCLADELLARGLNRYALEAYEAKRRPVTEQVVLANRRNPPDAILREVYERTGDRPFGHISQVISEAELTELSQGYQRIAGFDRETLDTQAESGSGGTG